MTNLVSEFRELLAKTTQGDGSLNHCPVNESTVVKIKEGMVSALEGSQEYDGHQNFWWIETKEGLTVAYFGNGPSSEANAELWTKTKNDLPKLLDELEYSNTLCDKSLDLLDIANKEIERYVLALNLCKEQRNRFRHNAIEVHDKSDLWVRLDKEIQQILDGKEGE